MSSPKKKRPTASSKKFPPFPSFNPTPFSRCEHVFAAKPPKLWQLWQQSKGAAHGDGDLSGSLGRSPSRHDRDNEAQMLQRSTPPWQIPGMGKFRRPKMDACSCDSKFSSHVKSSKVSGKKILNSIFIGHLFLGYSMHQVYKQNSIHVSFVGNFQIWMKLLQLLWVDACWFSPQMRRKDRRYKDLDFLSRCKKLFDAKKTKLRVHDIMTHQSLMNTKILCRWFGLFQICTYILHGR